MTKFRRELGMRIIEAREAIQMSQQELAECSGLSRGMICYWESGKYGINLERLMKLSKALGVSVGWLVGEVRG